MLNPRASLRPKVSFVDPCSARGYDLTNLKSGGLGGTEATVLRVARALQPDFDVSLYQNGRRDAHATEAGQLLPLADIYQPSTQSFEPSATSAAIVVINRWKVAVKLRKSNPDIPIFLWLHVYPGRHNRKMGAALKAAAVTVICVSKTHAEIVTSFLEPYGLPPIIEIYNPLADTLRPDDTHHDPDKLLFASSPHKGLAEVFTQFSTLRDTIPQLTLAVADPGYLSWETGPVPDGVTFLGSLSHPELIQQMRTTLCLFYPQTTFAETFGLVLAEANAVGTPVLVHAGLGANSEIVSDADQTVNGHDPAEILSRITSWRHTAPQVDTNPAFRMSQVARKWTELLNDAAAKQTPALERIG